MNPKIYAAIFPSFSAHCIEEERRALEHGEMRDASECAIQSCAKNNGERIAREILANEASWNPSLRRAIRKIQSDMDRGRLEGAQ